MQPTTQQPVQRRRNPWLAAIIIYFIVFAAAMVAWTVYASRQRIDLVQRDYYEKEILFQEQIEATSRGRVAGMKVGYDPAGDAVTIMLPAMANRPIHGTIHFYRPNNARLDRDVPLNLALDGAQRLDARSLEPGLWKIRVSWDARGEACSIEQSIVVGKSL